MSPEPQPSTPGRDPRHHTRLPWIIGMVMVLLGTGSAAYAFWESLSSTNYAAAAADSLTPGPKPAVTASGTALTVTWPAATTTAGHPVTGYTVTRYATATGGTGTPATGGCTGTVTALNCTEQNVQGGIWYYTVTPAIALWKGTESPRSNGVSNDTTAPVATASISPAPNTAGWNNTSPVTVTVSAQDGAAGSGVASITYTIDSGAPVTINAATTAIPVSGDGTHTVSYFATDNVGNVSTTQTQRVRIDTSAPAAPALSVPAYVNAANAASVPVSGTAEANATVSLTVRDAGSAHTVTTATTASAAGSWTLNPNLTTLNQGTVSYAATATDAAGNTGPATTATDTKDTVAPVASSLTVPAYVNTANVTAVPVSGTAEAGTTITLTAADTVPAHTVTTATTASAAGAWSFTTLNLAGLDQGTLTYTATVKDAAGNTGAPATATDTKDTVAPAAPTLTTPQTYVYGGNLTSFPVNGTAEAGSFVTLTVTDPGSTNTVSRTVTASGTGTWTLGVDLSSLNDGALTFKAAARDAAGNTGTTYTSPGPNTKDVVAPTLSTTANAVRLLNGGVAGTADAGDTLTIQYSETMDASKFCSTWNNNGPQTLSTNNDVSVTISHSATANTLAVASKTCTLNIGTISLGANANYAATTTPVVFAGVNANVSTVSWNPATNSLIIKLGGTKNGTGTLGTGTIDYPVYTPPSGALPLTDLAGNTLGAAAYTSATKTGF
jgi:Bacterial Ig-like domain